MSNPAVEAAQRAERKSRWWESGNQTAWDTDYAEASAREVLAPIRELHKSWAEAWATPPMWDEGGTAQNAVKLLLRDLARLIYTSEELK